MARAKPGRGRPSRLAPRQRLELDRIILAGALACGFPDNAWNARRVAELIRRKFRVDYHQGHAWRILKRLRPRLRVPVLLSRLDAGALGLMRSARTLGP